MEHLDEIKFLVLLGGVLVSILLNWFNKNNKQDNSITILQEQLKSSQEMAIKLIETNKNHIHTLSEQHKSTEETLSDLKIGMARIEAVIQERLPSKTNGLNKK